jgi:phosphatidylglycerophosphatase A
MSLSGESVFFKVSRLFATVAGVGFCPKAPGTAGSALPFGIFLFICPVSSLPIALWTVLGFFSLPCIRNILKSEASLCELNYSQLPLSRSLVDPSYIVIDEVVGQLFTFFIVSLFYTLNIKNLTLSFCLFRFFDIVKPWPIRALEHFLERKRNLWIKSFSVLFDDILAGFFAGISVLFLEYLAIVFKKN